MSFTILWPEKRVVSAKQISVWYGDAKFNGELDACDMRLHKVADQALALHRAGVITLQRQDR